MLFALGAALRVVTQLAYDPALIYWDTYPYLASMRSMAPSPLRPFGYSAFLALLPLEHGLEIVPFVQHVLGLAMAVIIYALLLRLGVRRWLAAAAAAPVLFDAFQLHLEQQIMSETLFELLIVGGLALVLWNRRPNAWMAAGAGLLLASAVLTRPNALLVVVPAAVAVFVLRGLRGGVLPVLAMGVTFVTIVGSYMVWFHSFHGVYAITDFQGTSAYARVATVVDCSTLQVPDYQRVLCPREPIPDRLPIDDYIWSKESPRHDVVPPRGMTTEEVVGDFVKRAIRQQPVPYLRAAAYDFIRGFWPVRTAGPKDVAVARWQFQHTYPLYNSRAAYEVLHTYGHDAPLVRPALTAVLVAWRYVANTPGPLLFLALLAGLASAAGLAGARDTRLRAAAFLFSSAAVAVLVPPALIIFSWRYQLPQLVLLPPAAAVAFTLFKTPAGDGSADVR